MKIDFNFLAILNTDPEESRQLWNSLVPFEPYDLQLAHPYTLEIPMFHGFASSPIFDHSFQDEDGVAVKQFTISVHEYTILRNRGAAIRLGNELVSWNDLSLFRFQRNVLNVLNETRLGIP
jgi:hypothetical protein